MRESVIVRIEPDEYAKLRSVLTRALPPAYDSWLTNSRQLVRQQRRQGYRVVEVTVSFEDFENYRMTATIAPNYDVLYACAVAKLRRERGHTE